MTANKGQRLWNQDRTPGPKPWVHVSHEPPKTSWWLNVDRQAWSTTVAAQIPRWQGQKDT